MRNIAIFGVSIFVLIASLATGIYYWYKKQGEPPSLVVYNDIEEIDRDIARFEPLYKAGKLRWQEMYMLGIAYMHKDRTADAVDTLEQTVNLYPYFYKTYESLGMAYYRMDNIEKAVEVWEKALKASPQAAHLEDMINRGKQRIEFNKRISSLTGEVEQDSTDWQKRFELALLYIAIKRIDEAKFHLEEVLKAKRDSADVYDAAAQVYALSGDFKNAVAAEKKAVELRPDDDKLKDRLAEMERIMQGLEKGEYHKTQENR